MEQDLAQFEEVRQGLLIAQKNFNAWTSACKTNMANSKLAHTQRVQEDKENIAGLQNQMNQLTTKEQELNQIIQQEKEEAQALQMDLNELQNQKESITLKKNNVELELQDLNLRLEKEKQVLAQKEQQVKQRALDAEMGVVFFQSRLGLLIKKRKEGNLLFSFTQIDPADPLQPFNLIIRVEENGTYSVTACDPAIEGLEGMLRKLNETNNLSSFISTVRRSFKNLVPQI